MSRHQINHPRCELPAIAAVVGFIGGGTAATAFTAGVLVTAGIKVALVAGSLLYSRAQARKQQQQAQQARARAERLARQQQAAALASLRGVSRDLPQLDFSVEEGVSTTNGLLINIRRSTVNRRTIYGRAKVAGIWTYIETTGGNNEYVQHVLTLCEGPVDAIEEIYIGDELVTMDADGNGTGKWAGNLVIKKYLGTESQVADATLIGASNGKWTSAHKLTGVAYLYCNYNLNTEVFPSFPEVSAVVRGKNTILDPRTGLRGYSDNAALCLADYLTTPTTGPGIAWGRIDSDALIHAANVCDEPVQLLAGGNEKRYRVSGSVDLGDNIEDNIAPFLQAMAGDMVLAGGSYFIQAGEYLTPTFEITADMMASGVTFTNKPPRKNRFNMVKGTYVAEANKWQRFDYPPVTVAEYVTEDGSRQVKDSNLAMVSSSGQAQRLASIELEQSRRFRTLKIRCSLRALQVRTGGTVLLTLGRYFNQTPFRVVEQSFVLMGNGAPLLDIDLVETNADIYAWDRTREHQANVPPEINAKGLTCAQPSFVDPPGAYSGGSYPKSIAISTLTSGATIRYSLTDVPASSADGTLYSAPVSVASGETLYARAFLAGYTASAPTIGAYTTA